LIGLLIIIKLFRCASTDYKWQFALVDLEWSLNPNGETDASGNHFNFLDNTGPEHPYTDFWVRLIQNDEYSNNFINRFADLMNTNYIDTTLLQMEQEIFDEVLPEMQGQFDRWGLDTTIDYLANFIDNHEIFNSELKIRSDYVREDIQERFNLNSQIFVELNVIPPEAGRIEISTISPSEYPWSGIYFSDVPITVKAISSPGYKFDSWEENLNIQDLSSDEFTVNISGLETDFTARFVQGTSEFNGVTISEINYKDGSNLDLTDWFEIYNASDKNLDITGWYFTDNDPSHKFVFNNQKLDSGERLIVVKSVTKYLEIYPDSTNVTGNFSFKLGSNSDEINLYDNNDSLIVSVTYYDIAPWPLNNNFEGRTLELIDPSSDLSDANNWKMGCVLGSPGY